MSSVDPSNTYNGYYIKHLSDLEDELKADYSRAKKNAEDQSDEVARNYEKSARENSERTDETIGRIRSDMQEHYDQSQENERNELERIKSQNYDRYGRDRSGEADKIRERAETLARGMDGERAEHEKRIQDMEHATELKQDVMAENYRNRVDHAVQTERDSSQRAFEDLTQKQKSALQTQNEESAKKYEGLSQARLDDQTENRRRTETLIADSQRDMDNLEQHLNGTIDQRLEKDHQAGVEREEAAADRLRQSHDLQSRELREQLRTLLASEGRYPKDKAQAKAEAVREFEDEWRGRLNAMDDAHRQEITKLHSMADENDRRSSQASDAKTADREAYYTGLIQKQGNETREEHNRINDRYNSAIADVETRAKRDRDFADKRLEDSLRSSNEEHENVLRRQAESFQASSANQKQLDEDKIDALRKTIERKAYSTDEADISPAAENAVRRSIVRQYEKNLNTETERNQRLVDGLQRSYTDRYQGTLDQHQTEMANMQAEHQTELHQNEAVFNEHIADTEDQKNESLRRSQEDHDRQTETLSRVYSQAQVKQRNEYESIIQAIKDDASSRIQSNRQESEFALKQQQRAFSVKENEIIREYEKKLADQKVDYESTLEEIRNQTQSAIRDAQRQAKQNYDDQGRGYEQKISQLEDQHTERERYITQNFEDQLEKVRRSNALLQSKKG